MSHMVKIEFFDFSERNLKVQPCNLKNYSVWSLEYENQNSMWKKMRCV